MPLLTARDFPGINSVPDNSGLAQGVYLALQGVQQRKALADAERKEQIATQLETAGAQALRIRNMETASDDPVERRKSFDRQRAELARMMRAMTERGEDTTLFDSVLEQNNPDQFNLALTGLATRTEKGRSKIIEESLKTPEAFTLGPGQTRFEGGEEIASVGAESAPSTAIGKARADLKNGLITQKEFDTISATPEKFQSSVGKLIGDLKLATQVFGKDSPQVKAIRDAIKSEQEGEDTKLTDIAGIRKEFTKQSGDFIQMRDAFNKIQSASDTGAGDVSLIFSFMKIIDPGSTVREGEFATAEQTAGIPTRIVNLYNQALEGDRLGDTQRQAFKAEAGNLFNAQLRTQKGLEKSFSGLATRANMNPEDVAIDFVGDLRDFQPVETPQIESVSDDLTPEQQARLDELRKKQGQ